MKNKYNIPVVNSSKRFDRPNEMIWHNFSKSINRVRYDRNSKENEISPYDKFGITIDKYLK